MKLIKVENAIGHVLCHDITQIIPGKFKGRAFRKGHIIQETDIPKLLSMGKEHLYVWELTPGCVHEDEAGVRVAEAIKGPNIYLSDPCEGKVELFAQCDGLCIIREDLLFEINMIDEVAAATINNARPVKKGDLLAGIRVVPLTIAEEKLDQVEIISRKEDVISVLKCQPRKVGIVTTGNEVYNGLIKDQFGPVIKEKAEAYGCKLIQQIIVDDSKEKITRAVKNLIANGAELIFTTGGMSVDPDDVTPSGIRDTGARIVTYGAPVLPGAMLMVAYLNNVPILGLPGCVMYNTTTAFDLILPLVLCGQQITRQYIAKLGMGGLCLKCPDCRYPRCSFGTGA